MKTNLQTTEYKEVEIDFPLFAKVVADMDETYVRIDEKDFRIIEFKATGQVSVNVHGSHNCIAQIWYDNQCSKEEWNQAVKFAKHRLNKVVKI